MLKSYFGMLAVVAVLGAWAAPAAAQIPSDANKLAIALKTAQRPADLTGEQGRQLDALVGALRDSRKVDDAVRAQMAAFAQTYITTPDAKRLSGVVFYVVMAAAAQARDRAALDAFIEANKRTADGSALEATGEGPSIDEQKRVVNRLGALAKPLYAAGLPAGD